jgi:hypothetical protein
VVHKIPVEAKCETLHRWTMRHPAPHILELVFDVPTPTPKQLAIGRSVWGTLIFFWVALTCFALPRLDVVAVLLSVPAIAALFVLNKTARVQRLFVDSKDRTVVVTELRAGKSVQRVIPFLEVSYIGYTRGYSAGLARPAAVWIEVEPPYEIVCLSSLGVLQNAELIDWLRSMVFTPREGLPFNREGAARSVASETPLPDFRPPNFQEPHRVRRDTNHPVRATMDQPSPSELEALERQAREAFRPRQQPIWQTTLVVASLLGGGYGLVWGNATFGGLLIVCGTFLRWLFNRME